MTKSKLTIRVHDTDKIYTIAEWCKANLEAHEWDMTAINLINPPDYKFHFECDKTRLQVILQHL